MNIPVAPTPPGDGRHPVVSRLRNYFLAGVLITAPIAITLYVTWSLVDYIDAAVTGLLPAAINPRTYFDVPGVGNGRPDGDSVRLYWRRDRGAPPSPSFAAAAELPRLPSGERVVACPLRAGQQLWWRGADGIARTLLAVDVDTVAVVALAAAERGGALGVDGHGEPVLTLAPL